MPSGSTAAGPAPAPAFPSWATQAGPLSEVLTHNARQGEPLLDRLRQRLAELRPADIPDLPFEFDCGFVGYLGYEMKSECGCAPGHPTNHPDAAFIFSDRLIAFDHEQQHTYVLCLHKLGEEEAAEKLDCGHRSSSKPDRRRRRAGRQVLLAMWDLFPALLSTGSLLTRSREQYLEDVRTLRSTTSWKATATRSA